MRYLDNIIARFKRQEGKGINKYGQPLELNHGDIEYRLEHLAEELSDGLMYIEWIKEKAREREMKPLTIYIAGPLSAPTKHGIMVNVRKAFDVALGIAKKGHIFYSPHLSVYFDEYAQEKQVSLPWEYWMQFDDAWVQKCDAFYYIGSSRGADIELARAKELRKQILYSLDEVPEVKEV